GVPQGLWSPAGRRTGGAPGCGSFRRLAQRGSHRIGQWCRLSGVSVRKLQGRSASYLPPLMRSQAPLGGLSGFRLGGNPAHLELSVFGCEGEATFHEIEGVAPELLEPPARENIEIAAHARRQRLKLVRAGDKLGRH